MSVKETVCAEKRGVVEVATTARTSTSASAPSRMRFAPGDPPRSDQTTWISNTHSTKFGSSNNMALQVNFQRQYHVIYVCSAWAAAPSAKAHYMRRRTPPRARVRQTSNWHPLQVKFTRRLSFYVQFVLILLLPFVASAQPSKRMADGKRWTTRNIDKNISPSYCYNDTEANCRKYGRLYTWESAPRACAALGPGWRLPNDAEWRKLAQAYGGVSADSNDRGKAAFHALMTGGRSKFQAVLGGGRGADGKYGRIEAHGFYWTSSESSPPEIGWLYNFGKGGPGLHRQDGIEKTYAASVRCVKD